MNQNNAVSLHTQNGNNRTYFGSLAQLNRAFDYGSKGYRFESYASHNKTRTSEVNLFKLPKFFCF